MGLGGISRTLFGGSKSTSGNKAYDYLKGQYGGSTGYTGEAGGAVSKLLGGDSSGFDAYKNATGFNFGLNEGLDGITGGAASQGLLRSGPTSKALVRYGNDYQQQYARDFISQYLGLGQLGLGAGQLIGGAGQTSKSTSSSGGLGKAIGSALAMFSDRRLKRDIQRLGTLKNGLPWYEFRYLWDAADEPIRQGLMSDDVRAVRPEAVVVDAHTGFDGVRYDLAMAA